MKARLKENSLCCPETVLQASGVERLVDFCKMRGEDGKPMSAVLETDETHYLQEYGRYGQGIKESALRTRFLNLMMMCVR